MDLQDISGYSSFIKEVRGNNDCDKSHLSGFNPDAPLVQAGLMIRQSDVHTKVL